MRTRRPFTLIELLMVTGIIAILAAMLLPALVRARALAKAATCTSNQKQLAIVVEMYTDAYDGYMPRDIHLTQSHAHYQALANLHPDWNLTPLPTDDSYAGWETRILLAGIINSWDDAVRLLRCPLEPRPDWHAGYGPAATKMMRSTSTVPNITYIAAPCWHGAGKGGAAANYVSHAGWSPIEPMPRDQLLGRRSPESELLFVHAGGYMLTGFISRPSCDNNGGGANWGGYWTEVHPFGTPPKTRVMAAGGGGWPQLETADGLCSSLIYTTDFVGGGNPYACMDGHVEYQDNIWHDNNLWHADNVEWPDENNFTYFGVYARGPYAPLATLQSQANTAHGFAP